MKELTWKGEMTVGGKKKIDSFKMVELESLFVYLNS